MSQEEYVDIHYKRQMNHNYMIIDAPSEKGGYECQMLAGNSIEGLLKFRVEYQEEKRQFYYEITSRQPLSRMLEKRRVKGEEIRRLMLDLIELLRRIEEYLLNEEQLLLDPEYIYINPNSFRAGMCLVPGMEGDLPAALSGLLQYLLERVDHEDRDGVVIAYNLYQESRKENYGLCDLIRCLAPANDSIFDLEDGRGKRQKRAQDAEIGEEAGGYGREGTRTGGETEEEGRAENGDRGAGTWEWEQEVPAHMEEPRYRQPDRHTIWKEALKAVVLTAAAEGGLWYFMGESGVIRYGLPAAGGIALVLCLAAVGKRALSEREAGGRKTEKADTTDISEGYEKGSGFTGKDSEPEDSGWEIHPESQEEYHRRLQKKEKEDMERSREEGTTLLAKAEKSARVAILEPLNKAEESILISYVPFMIGKHSELSDYQLKRPEISRLHLRIDKKENVCIVTDLNSTNGTVVNGYALQANETVSVKSGDLIYLAGIGYKFIE